MMVHPSKIPELLPVQGVRLSACSSGVSKPVRNDLALLAFSEHASQAAAFTNNAFCAAPVIIAKKHLQHGTSKFCLINTGNANAGLGKRGLADAIDVCQCLADHAHTSLESVLPFSTGVIGEPLPVAKIRNAIPKLLETLKEDAWLDVAEAILTTDTRAKGISRKLSLPDGEVTITGIAKGSGMICPNMATMLAFIATNAKIDVTLLQSILKLVVAKSFNCIDVDGETSTNDACFLLATGESHARKIENVDQGAGLLFLNALNDICIHLAQAIVRDGEGATKFISVCVSGGQSEEACREVALSIANSPLVKTAFFASDPNWGRILSAVGQTPNQAINIENVSIALNDVEIVASGERVDTYTEADGQCIMAQDEITISVTIGNTDKKHTIWTCDLSPEYVHINSAYRS